MGLSVCSMWSISCTMGLSGCAIAGEVVLPVKCDHCTCMRSHVVNTYQEAWICSHMFASSCCLYPSLYCLQGSIEGRRDLAGGRLSSDRRALGNSTSGQCFTSLAFSADGAFLLAGGSTKYVCMYDVEEKVMLRRFQVRALVWTFVACQSLFIVTCQDCCSVWSVVA